MSKGTAETLPGEVTQSGLAGRLNCAFNPSLLGFMTGTGAARQTAIAVPVLVEGHTSTERGHHWRPNAPRISGTGTFFGDRRLMVCDALVNSDCHAVPYIHPMPSAAGCTTKTLSSVQKAVDIKDAMRVNSTTTNTKGCCKAKPFNSTGDSAISASVLWRSLYRYCPGRYPSSTVWAWY